MNNIVDIIRGFAVKGEPVSCEQCLRGHINRTYTVSCKSDNGEKKDYILQRVNGNVFKNPKDVMNNIVAVTSYLRSVIVREGGNPDRETLTLIKTLGGDWYHIDGEGEMWRVYEFIGDTVSYDTVDDSEIFRNAGYSFGHFQRQLDGFDASVLKETIPNFHNTVSRLKDFKLALSENRAGRRDEIKEEAEFILSREKYCSAIIDGIADGRYPLRVTHNDTKLNNILMDRTTGKGVCIIDLDTVMPGSALYDFGDSIRFGASSAAEDETDLNKVYMRTEMFEAFTDGFVSGANGALNRDEISALPMSAIIITLEIGMRFLGDYLNGDTYFSIHRPKHNLDRARTQLKLVSDMESKLTEMNAIAARYL